MLEDTKYQETKQAIEHVAVVIRSAGELSRCARPAGFRFVHFNEKKNIEQNARSLIIRLLGFYDDELEKHFASEIQALVFEFLENVKFVNTSQFDDCDDIRNVISSGSSVN
ncbi:hypothetical protein [Photobacterium sp. R1]